jgi:hypothetical protein
MDISPEQVPFLRDRITGVGSVRPCRPTSAGMIHHEKKEMIRDWILGKRGCYRMI